MRRLLLLYRSLVGKKVIVAVTGAILMGFLLFHAVGNLKVFLPGPTPDVPDIDVYARFLRTMGEPILPHSAALWIFRVVLSLALLLHVDCVVQLARHNRRARPLQYERVEYVETTTAARWMLYSGTLLLLFVLVHLPHLTTGHLDAVGFTHGAVYANLHHAFGQWQFTALYLVAMGALSSHLYHGAWSMFQSLGLDSPDRNRGLRRMALLIAVAVPVTFASVPLAFFTGMLEPPPPAAARIDGSH